MINFITQKSKLDNIRLLILVHSVEYSKIGRHLNLIRWRITSSCEQLEILLIIQLTARQNFRLLASREHSKRRPERKLLPKYLRHGTQRRALPSEMHTEESGELYLGPILIHSDLVPFNRRSNQFNSISMNHLFHHARTLFRLLDVSYPGRRLVHPY